MPFVLTLIADKAKTILSHDLAALVSEALAENGLKTGQTDWLSDGEACDIPFEGDPELAISLAHGVLGDKPIDAATLPSEQRRKRLLIADMDSTMIGQECIDELADEIGQMKEVSEITERAMNGEIEFEAALRQRVALLEGIPVEAISRTLAERITLTPGGRTLVRTMTANGALTALVSGGFTAFAGPLADRIGFQRHRANILLEQDGKLSGKVAEPIIGRDAKLAMLRELVKERGLEMIETLAVGDGANDLAMLEEAGFGVAYHAKPSVRQKAQIKIDHTDLTSLLFIQGYRRDEFQ